MPEIWKPIKGYEGSYEVSDHGRVRSLDRFRPRRSETRGVEKFFVKGRIMKPFQVGTGAVKVNLTDDLGQTPYVVARLVAETFRPHPHQHNRNVIHRDRDPWNNHIKNLRWAKPDVAANFMSYGAFRKKRYQIDRAKVRTTRKLLKKGLSQYKIAEMLCLAQGTVSKIANGEITLKGRPVI